MTIESAEPGAPGDKQRHRLAPSTRSLLPSILTCPAATTYEAGLEAHSLAFGGVVNNGVLDSERSSDPRATEPSRSIESCHPQMREMWIARSSRELP